MSINNIDLENDIIEEVNGQYEVEESSNDKKNKKKLKKQRNINARKISKDLVGKIKNKSSKLLREAKLIVDAVNLNKEEYRKLSIEDLKKRSDFLSEKIKKGELSVDEVIVDAFSIMKELIWKVHSIDMHDVQLIGAYIVYSGNFSEMKTGEGKTLTVLFAAYANALSKKPVHIITVNEYLVKRDAETAEEIFKHLGITVGYNTSELQPNVKKEMFSRDITYTTNSELGFDYLRDNMVKNYEDKVLRRLEYAIIDEGDSVLIDEARTPLIISGMPKDESELYNDVDKFVRTLKSFETIIQEKVNSGELTPEEAKAKIDKNNNEEERIELADFTIDLESNAISLTDNGTEKAEKFFNIPNLHSIGAADLVHKINNSLTANFVFKHGREYIVRDDKILLVDSFTGRILEGHSYNAGLQQAIQAKEGVKIEPENQILATITYQSFFRLYKKLSALSGTAATEAEEFLKTYNMIVVVVPTHKPIARIDQPDYIFGSKDAKWRHVIAEIENRHKKGQPILVGTSSVKDSEMLHEELNKRGIQNEILNAKNHAREAEIVKNAGQIGSITISTNMAGRGTDIKITDEVRELGGLYVIGTERNESRRIDNQLRGRSGRQGDPGESRFFTSLEDSLFKRFATDKFEKASMKLSEEEFFDSKFFSNLLDRTQKKVEGFNFDVRKNVMDYDHVLSLQRELIYKQRDQILLNKDNSQILINMSKDVTEDILKVATSDENSAIVDPIKIAGILNMKILKFDYFFSNEFENLVKVESQIKINKIIETYIKSKYGILKKLGISENLDKILLQMIDVAWTRHLDKLNKLRDSVNLRAYEQKTPLNIYIEEGNNYFEEMKKIIVHSSFFGFNNMVLPNQSQQIKEDLDLLFKDKKDNSNIVDTQN